MIGTLLNDRFRLEEQIGSGGMSTVYRAFDETLERWVAIKLMHREIAGDADQLERFRREARAVARLTHPHIVTVIDFGADDDHPFIVLEYVEGETLKQRIRRVGPLPVVEAVAYAIEVGRALERAHEERIVHRDVKPQNVLIDPDGRAKVTDFGIARELDTDGLTAVGRVLGTTDYVAPEQALGEQVSAQSDVYSLGICLFEMLTGEVPFKAETQVAVAMKHVREPLPDVQQIRPEISATVAAIVEHACAKETRNRFASARDMVDALEQALAVEAARHGETSGEATTVLRALKGDTADFAPLRLRRPGRVLLLTLLAAALVAGGVVFLVTRAEQGSPGGAAAEGAGGLSPVNLRTQGAGDFDPPPGDRDEHPEAVGRAIDEIPGTHWETEDYSPGGGLGNKPGVGMYVEAREPVAARRLDLVTSTPGWAAEIYGASEVPDDLEGWTRISRRVEVDDERARIDLDAARQEFRFYLVWIVDLELPGPDRARIQELTLLR